MSDLKPCPFCGRSDSVKQHNHYVSCSACVIEISTSLWKNRPLEDTARQEQKQKDIEAAEKLLEKSKELAGKSPDPFVKDVLEMLEVVYGWSIKAIKDAK